MAEYLDDLWSSQGFFEEGLELTKQLFALPNSSAPEIRANRFQQASDLAWQVHDFETALAFAQQAAELGRTFNLRGQHPWYLNRLGRIYIEQQRYPEARQVLTECLALVHSDSSGLNIGCPLAQLGEVALFENKLAEAKSTLAEAIHHLTASDGIFLAIALVDMAEIALAEDDFEQARDWLARAYGYSGRLMRRTLVFLIATAGYLTMSPTSCQQELVLAARLYGAIENLAEHSGIILGGFYRQLNEQRIKIIHHNLSRNEWQREVGTGRLWSKETAMNEIKVLLKDRFQA